MKTPQTSNPERLAIYVSCLYGANSMLVSYRSMFLVIETLLFTLGMYFSAKKGLYFWMTVILGLVYCLAFLFILSWGRKRVDYWRDRIFEEVKNSELEKIFEIYKPSYIRRVPSPISPRFWLDITLPIIITAFWILLIIWG